VDHSRPKNRSEFELEALESRVLLSADAFLALAATGVSGSQNQAPSIVVSHQDFQPVETQNSYDPAASTDGIFDGIELEPIALTDSAPGVETAPDSGAESSNSDTQFSPVASSAVAENSAAVSAESSAQKASEQATVSRSSAAKSGAVSTAQTALPASGTSTSGNVLTQQLTDTLKAANGPPASASKAVAAVENAAQISENQSVANSSNNASSTASVTPSSGLTSGLPQYIQSQLDALTADGEFTFERNLGTIELGDFLQLTNVTLKFTGTRTTVEGEVTYSGSVQISADSAVLFPGKSFSGIINNPVVDSFTLAAASTSVTLSATPVSSAQVDVHVNGDEVTSGYSVSGTTLTFANSQPVGTEIEASYLAKNAITGTYTIGGTYSLKAENLVIQIGDALVVAATDVTFSYNSNGTETQELVSVGSATVTSSQFTGFSAEPLTNFKIRADGFSFDSVGLSSTSAVSLGNLISATSVNLTVSDFDVSFGTSTTDASLTGTVTLTLTGLQLFPNGGFIQSQATSVTGSYDFGTFDGTSPTGQLTLTIVGFELTMGEAFRIRADGDVVLTPGQEQIATIASATLDSPQFGEIGAVSLTNLVLNQTGFSLEDLTISTGGSPTALGSFITFDSLSVSFTDFVFTYGSQPQVDGTVEVTATNVVLFPNISFLDLHLSNLKGTYIFGGASRLSIGIPNLDITIGQALTIHLGHVSIEPGQAVMLTVAEATVSSSLFNGLETVTIHGFSLTQNGFSLDDLTIEALPEQTLSLGGFLEFGSVTIVVTDLVVDSTAVSKFSGNITVAVGGMTLFPGSTLVTSTFSNVVVSYDFAGANATGRLKIKADSFSLNIAGQLNLSGDALEITPDQDTFAVLASATLTLPSLNNLEVTITNLSLQKTGFSIASATVTSNDIVLGGLFSLTSPELTFTNVNYVMGGSLSGTITFVGGATLSLGGAIETNASNITATYNFDTKVFSATIDSFNLNVGGFVSISASGVALSYSPATDGSSKFLLGATGVDVLMGSSSGGSESGVKISDAKFGLAVFRSSDAITSYALEATGGITLVGMPANTLSLSAQNVKVRVNTAGEVEETVQVDSNPENAVTLQFEANEQSLLVSNLTLTIGSFITLTGNFGFQTFTDPITNLTNIVIGASSVNAFVGSSSTNLTINGASFGLIIRPGTTGNTTTYALIANGGTNALNGVPGLSLSASGLKVKVNTTGLDPETLSGLPQNVVTPDGELPIDFSELGSADVMRVEGSITLSIAGFLSLEGDFAFETFTDSGTGLNNILVAATGVTTVLGTDLTNLTIEGASLGLAVISGANGAPATYVLVAEGGTNTLNGVPGLELIGSGLKVRINTTGVDPTTLGVPATLETPGGLVDMDFSGLGAGNIKDIQGHITLNVLGFVSLEGDFGFQSFTDSNTGLTNMAIGATGISAVLGTSDLNLTIEGASLALLVISGANGTPTRYALVANGGTNTLNGIPGLELSASGLAVKINNLGQNPSLLPGVPLAVSTPGGDIALDFAGLGAGNTKSIEGTITLEVLGFVSLHGSFSFQTFTDLVSGATDIAVAATGVNATLAVGDVSLVIEGASLGLLMLPGSNGGPSSYALVANGGTSTLNGVPGLSLSGSGLQVRINNTGVDVAARAGTTTLQTPGGSVDLDFSDLGSGPVMAVQGNITLNIAGFVSLTGDFGFQKYTDTTTTQTRMLMGAKNLTVVLGTADTNVSIVGASLGVMILSGTNGNPGTYALVANGGTASLNGVPGLTLTSTGLTVKVNTTGLDPETLASTPVQTSDGEVVLDFEGLGSGNVTHVEGSVVLAIADFVSIEGSFVFTKQIDASNPNVTKIVVGASGVKAFLGTEDESIGVRISDARLGLVIFKNTVANTSTYALYASTEIEAVGLPSEIQLVGNAALMVNNTGAGVNEVITTQAGDVTVKFTDGTGGSADQRNIRSFSGALSLTINAGSSFTLTGNFAFAKTGTGTATKVLIGASGVSCSNIIPDGGSGSLALENGSLGMVIYSDASGGYALTASATVVAGAGSSGANATLTIRRNATNHAVNETVSVGTAAVQVKFSETEIKTGTSAFQKISVSDATINIENIFIITAGGGSTSVVGGVTTRTLTEVSLTVQDPGTGQVLFTISAASASYITIVAGTVFDGMTWTNGGTQIVLNDLSFSLGGYVTFTGESVKIRHYVNASNATVNSFNFTQASVALFVDGSEMAALQGNLAFRYSTTEGFVLESTGSAPITGFSFLGQSIGSVSAPTVGGAGTSAAGPTTTHTIGPVTLGTPSIGFTNFSFGLDGTLSVTVSISDTLASINGGVISAAVKNLTGSFTLGLKLDLANPFAPPTNVTASGFNLSIGQLEIAINVSSQVSLKFTANNVFINPSAGPTQDLVSFGGTTSAPGLAATLSVPGITLTGGASNFAIKGNGSFVAGNNFTVTLSLGENSASSLKWPDWLPIKDVTIGVEWPGNNFNTDPANFILDLSATVDLNSLKGIPLSVSGTINHVRIDVGKLADGVFPIIDIESVAVSVSGNLFGGTVSGSLLAGVVRFDSNGAVVDSQGRLVTNGQPGVGPFTSVFYGGISASFSFGGMSGFALKLGLSEYGPLSVYISASTPTGILLEPNSGLTLNNFRGGVTFGQGLPTVTISNPISPDDALQLRQPGFQSPATMTDAQWLVQMKSQVATLYKTGATDGWANLGASTITIQAGATIYSAYLSQNSFKIDADVFFDTSGKILILGTATFGNTLTIGMKLYADLAPVFDGSVNEGAPVNILFLMDTPAQVGTPIAPPILSIYGIMQFEFSRVDNQPVTAENQADAFKIRIAGAAELNVLGGFQAKLSGNVDLTFSSTSFQITIFNVALNMSYLGEVGTAAGDLTIQKNSSGGLDIWGAFVLNANLQALQEVGIYAGGQIYFQLNTTAELKTVPLVLTTGTINVTIAPQSFGLFVNGSADFHLFGQRVFTLAGTLAVNLNVSTTTPGEFTLTIFVQAQLMIGPVGNPIFTYNANGLIYVDQTGFAAKMTLAYGGSPLTGFSMGVNWVLVVNTTLREISYEIPEPLPTSPATPPVATVMGPNFGSSNVTALMSYETIVDGKRMLIIPRGAPPSSTTNYANWTAAAGEAYFILVGRGNLTLANAFTISGTINLVASYNPLTGLSFSFSLNAKLNLTVNGTNIFSFSVIGGIQINSSGLAAALTINFASGFSMPSNLGFTISATFMLQINTTGAPVTVTGTSITVQPGARVVANGNISVPGLTITGSFTFSVTPSSLSVEIKATVNIFGSLMSVNGFAGIYYDSNPGFAFSIQLKVGSSTTTQIQPVAALGNLFSISGEFTLQINTSSVARNGIASGFKIAITNLDVFLFGFHLSGTISISITSAGLSINIPESNPLTLDFFGIVTLSVHGYLNPNGTFSFTASAGFSFGEPGVAYIGGRISVTFSNGGFSATVAGRVDFLGVSVTASGTITITNRNVTMSIYVYCVVVPAIHIHTPAVKVAGVTIIPAVNIDTPPVIVSGTWTVTLGQTDPPPPPPPTPVLGTVTSGVLVLNLGQDVGARGEHFGAQDEENYVITNVVGNPGSSTGQTIQITALGYTQTYTNVTSILVRNTLSGNDTITISNGVTATVDITLGNGNNIINTGGGFATVRDRGTGSNTITGGSGGGVYIGGLNGSNAAYATKGITTINAGTGNFSVQYAGYSSYTLTQTLLQAGTYLIYLNGVANVDLTAATGSGAHVFNLNGWYGSGSITGNGSNNTLNVNPQTTLNVAFVLSDASLQTTIGNNPSRTMTLAGIQVANLTGGSNSNTMTVSGWTGTGSLTGPAGSTNTVVAVNNTNFVLTNLLLTRAGHGDLQLTNFANAILTGGAGVNTFTVNGDTWTGHATLNGVNGNDIYNITLNGIGSTLFTIADSTPNSGDVLNVSVSVDTIVLSNQIKAGGQQINYSGVGVLNINGTVTGTNYYIRSTHASTATNILAFGANNVFTVGSNAGVTPSAASSLDGILGALTITGTGSDTLNLDDTASTVAKTGLMTSTGITGFGTEGINYSGIAILNISLGSGADTFTVVSTNASMTTTVNLGFGDDIVNIGNVLDLIAGELTVNGQGGSNTLNFSDAGSVLGKTGFLTASTLLGLGMGPEGVTFSSFAVLALTLGSGNDVLNVLGTNATTLTTVNTGAGANVLNISSNAPVGSGGVLAGLAGRLIVNGQGTSDTMNLDDSGNSAAATLTLTSTTVTGLGMGNDDPAKGVEFHGIETLNIQLGSNNNTLLLKGSPANATTNIITGTGSNQIAVGTSAQATAGALSNGESPNTGSSLEDILGSIVLIGSGTDVLNVDDTGSTGAKTGVLSATTLTGLGMGGGGITYFGMAALTVALGSGNDTLTITSTTANPVQITGNGGADVFNVQATTGLVVLHGGSGADTFNLGSVSPGVSGNVNGIAGLLELHGGLGVDVLNVDETGEIAGNTGLFTATTLTGLGMTAGVEFSETETININLGAGSDTFNVQSVLPTVTLTVSLGAGVDVLNLGSTAPVSGGTVNEILGTVVVIGSGNDVLNVDDSGDADDNAGSLVPATLTGLGLGSSVTYSGLAELYVFLGSGDDTFTVNDMTESTVTRIDGGEGINTAVLNFTSFGAVELSLIRFESATLVVVNDFTGLLNLDGKFTTATIGGTLTQTGVLNAGAIDLMTIDVNLAGLVNVAGLLQALVVHGASPGKVIAGDVHTITVDAGFGGKLLQVIENGIERQLKAPGVSGVISGSVKFAFIYDSLTTDVPQLAVRVTNPDATTRFNLVLAAHSATAKFNLARVEAVDASGISNITVDGDILTTISQAARDYLGLSADARSGIHLPGESITGVSVRDTLPIGYINVGGIQGLAFGFLVNQNGKPTTVQNALGSSGKPTVLWNILGSQAALLAATDEFLISFSETHAVSFYAQVDTDLSLDLVMTFNDRVADDAAVRAQLQIQPGATKKQPAVITSIQLAGDGASIDSQYAIGSITSTGSLGDVTVRGAQGLGSVTASSIFGSINVLNGGITGTIQTTGIRIDSITGEETVVNADIGQTVFNAKGKLTGVTTISAKGGINGEIISRGDLISSVTTGGSLTGLIAAQGNIGLILFDVNDNPVVGKNGVLTRFGGISAKNATVDVIALGNIYGDLSFKGTFSGRIAVLGLSIQGLSADRFGLLGNVQIKSFAEGSAIVSGGLIGDVGRTTVSLGSAKGFVTADGAISLAKGSKIAAAQVLANQAGTANSDVIAAIFTDSNLSLGFDTGGTLAGLGLIRTDLNSLTLSGGTLAGPTP